MKNIYVVGKPFMEQTVGLLECGLRPGILIDRKYEGVRFKGLNLFENVIYLDFSSKISLLKDLKGLNIKIDGLICLYENYLVPKAWIEQFYGLSGGEAVVVAGDMTDKLRMRRKLEKYDKNLNPDFQEISNLNELREFAYNHQFPLILKPANLVKSLLVSKSCNLKQLEMNYLKTVREIDGIYEKYGFKLRKPRIIVEEFMKGSQHSVAGFVDQEGEIHLAEDLVDLVSANDIGIDDQYLYARIMPSRLPVDVQDQIRKVAIDGLKALKLRKSPAHIEIMLTSSGPKIIEIAPRIGGYRINMFKLAGGADLQKAEVDIQLGNDLNLQTRAGKFCCVIELFPDFPGIFKKIDNWEKVPGLSSVNYYKVKAKLGQKVGQAKDGYKWLAIITLLNDDLEVLMADFEFIKSNIKIITGLK